MRARILDAAARTGRAPGEIACIYNLEVRIGSKDPDESIVSGEPSEIVERLLGFLEQGFSGMNFIVGGPDVDEQRERLAIEVLPALRAAA